MVKRKKQPGNGSSRGHDPVLDHILDAILSLKATVASGFVSLNKRLDNTLHITGDAHRDLERRVATLEALLKVKQ